MSDQATPETDFESYEIDGEWVVGVPFAEKLERERDQARNLARELLDALENCREDSVELLGEWDWKRNTICKNNTAIIELEGRINVADAAIHKAKEVLP
jgi:hypothetical protein